MPSNPDSKAREDVLSYIFFFYCSCVPHPADHSHEYRDVHCAVQDGEDEGAVEDDLFFVFRGEAADEMDGCGGFGFGTVAIQFDLCFVGELFVLRGGCGQGG